MTTVDAVTLLDGTPGTSTACAPMHGPIVAVTERGAEEAEHILYGVSGRGDRTMFTAARIPASHNGVFLGFVVRSLDAQGQPLAPLRVAIAGDQVAEYWRAGLVAANETSLVLGNDSMGVVATLVDPLGTPVSPPRRVGARIAFLPTASAEGFSYLSTTPEGAVTLTRLDAMGGVIADARVLDGVAPRAVLATGIDARGVGVVRADDTDGTFVLAWTTGGFGGGLQMARFAADGARRSDVVAVGNSSGGGADIAAFRGGVAVSWVEASGTRVHARYRIFDRDLRAVTDVATSDLPDLPGFAASTSVAPLPGGGVLLAFSGRETDTEGRVFVRALRADGALDGPPRTVVRMPATEDPEVRLSPTSTGALLVFQGSPERDRQVLAMPVTCTQ